MSSTESSTISNVDREKINDVTRRFSEMMLVRDFSDVASLYTQDCILMPPNHTTVRGASAIAEFLGTFPKITQFLASNDEIDGRGDLAYVRGSHKMTMQLDTGESVEDQGTYLEIRRRQEDGSWPITVDTFCSNVQS